MDKRVISSDFLSPNLETQSLSKLLFKRLQNNFTSIIDTTIDRKWNSKEVLISALNFAQFLREECGLERGDVVFFICENSDIHAIAIIGVLFGGGVYGSAPDHSSAREIQQLIELIEPKVLISTKTNSHLVKGFDKKFSLKTIDVTDIEHNFRRNRDHCGLPVETGLDCRATLVLSSGSSGNPKAIIRTNRNHLAVIEMFSHPEMQPIRQNDVILSSGFCHICGQRSLFSAVHAMAALAVGRTDESHRDIFTAVDKYHVTTAILIPTQLQWLLKNNYIGLKTLRDVVTGAAPLSADTHAQIQQKYGFEKFRNSYGMSESGFVLLVPVSQSRDLKERETVGRVAPGCHIKVIDDEGRPLPSNTIGEICIKGDQVSPGYLKSRENQRLFTSDGFLRSGDLGYYDNQAFFFITGRAKEIMKIDGVTVTPAELEHLLLAHKDVEMAAVVGVKHEDRGEVPKAFVTLVEGSEVTEEELISFIDSKVNDFKKLRGGLKIVERMPKTHSGKIKKSQLRDDPLFY